jgi:phosphoribosylanthranilate isomerase
MKIKVCGMSDAQSITEVARLSPDWMGFIFYPHSQRYVYKHWEEDNFISLLANIDIPKVAVFVNEVFDNIVSIVKKLGIDYVQLHGDESIETCHKLQSEGLKIIKTFGIHTDFDWDSTEAYMPYCDFFLFDTHTPAYGGSGQQFDWHLLNAYVHKKHFILSGGIDIKDIEKIVKLDHPMLHGIDINSKFETSPGVKDENKVFLAIQKIRNI